MAINSYNFVDYDSTVSDLYSAQTSMRGQRTGKHWILYLKPLVRLVLFLLLLNVGVKVFPSSFLFEFGRLFVLVALLTTLFSLSAIWLEARCTSYLLSSQNIQLKTGLTKISVFELSCSNIASVEVFQTIAGRFFDYGSVKITGNSGSHKMLTYVDNPNVFRQKCLRDNLGELNI